MRNRIPARYRGILFALVMSCSTSMIVSAIIIHLHGSHSAFIQTWLTAFITAWPIVFAAILVIAPQVDRLLNLFVEEHSKGWIDQRLP